MLRSRLVGFSNLALFTMAWPSGPSYLYDMSITVTHSRKAVTQQFKNNFRFQIFFPCHQVKCFLRNTNAKIIGWIFGYVVFPTLMFAYLCPFLSSLIVPLFQCIPDEALIWEYINMHWVSYLCWCILSLWEKWKYTNYFHL